MSQPLAPGTFGASTKGTLDVLGAFIVATDDYVAGRLRPEQWSAIFRESEADLMRCGFSPEAANRELREWAAAARAKPPV